MNRRARFPMLLAICGGTVLLAFTVSAMEGMAAGVSWKVPGRWSVQPARPMRVATYQLPAAKGADPGECGVFFFGHGQGGSVQENIARWGQQFEGGAPPATKVETVSGLRVHRASVTGTYLAPGGPMMQSQGKKAGWRLAGAIVEAPDGPVFFKCVGPDATIQAAAPDLEGLLRSIHKAAGRTF